MRKALFALLVALTSLVPVALVAAPASAATTRTVTVVANYTAANDDPNVLSNDAPRGRVVFTRVNGGTITYSISVSGLSPNTQYFPVPYKRILGQPNCAPLPGATAFPASPFKTDASGAATATGTLNAQALNPLGQFRLRETGAVSLRRVLGTVNLPTGTPPYPLNASYNLPNPTTEACDTRPVVTRRVSYHRSRYTLAS